MLPGLVMAAPAVADKADNAFMMIGTALGLVYDRSWDRPVYGGLIRGKNVLSMPHAGDRAFALLYSLGGSHGYSLAFGEGRTSSATLTG
ncbi:hypothetical protein ACNKHM_04835 [Shigella sonnei]